MKKNQLMTSSGILFSLRTNYNILDVFFFVNNDKKILLYDQISIPVFSKDDLIFLAFEFDLLFNEITVQYRHFKNLSIRKLLTITSVDYQLDKF